MTWMEIVRKDVEKLEFTSKVVLNKNYYQMKNHKASSKFTWTRHDGYGSCWFSDT